MTENLVSRLRELAAHNRQHFPLTAEEGYYALGDEAADRIQSLEAENARLEAEIAELREALQQNGNLNSNNYGSDRAWALAMQLRAAIVLHEYTEGEDRI